MGKSQATYPANLCPLLCGGDFAKFGSYFGEAARSLCWDTRWL